MMKKIISVVMAFVIALISCACTFTALADNYPYTATNNYGVEEYWRLSNGEYIGFNIDYDAMVSEVRNAFANHTTDFEYRFATTDEEYAYSYRTASDYSEALEAANKLYRRLMADVFGIESVTGTDYYAYNGDYLFNSISNIGTGENDLLTVGTTGINVYTSAPDDPFGENERYYTFRFSWEEIEYYTTIEQERMVNEFAQWFSTTYLSADMTEYERVKTIYDFIVRNTTYDWDVFRYGSPSGNDTISYERYNTAHSAYGAIFGNILDDIDAAATPTASGVFDFDTLFAYKRTVTDEKVPVNFDYGMAVCEGYSKLFCYLCTFNGIPCHIVDGDYIPDSGKDSDPHEWNYVYLMDESGDGYKWFQVDCTRSAQNSLKEIDINNYDYFLCGYESVYFGWKNHQQAYENKGIGLKEQLYDWYDASHRCSSKDYVFAKVRMLQSNLGQGYVIKRTTVYEEGGEERTAFIYCDSEGTQKVEINEDGIRLTQTEGFIYSGYHSTYTAVIPYIVNRVNILDDGTVSEGEYTTPLVVRNTATGVQSATACDAGNYTIEVDGAGTTMLRIPFTIAARDMSADAIEEDAVILAYDHANYNGNAITPYLTVTDPYKNTLVEGRDYTVYYTLGNNTVSSIKEIGDYVIHIVYKGNYQGAYTLDFTMNGIDLSQISYKESTFQYLPDYYREQNGISTAADYFMHGISGGLKIGTLTLYADRDFTVSAQGSLDYGSTGTIILTGAGSSNVLEGSTLTTTYKVGKKFSISEFDGKVADTNETNKVYYTGSAVKPTKFDVIDKYLVQGKDYKIVSYSNNVEVGYAYVTIQGINGCEGTATMKFYINQPTNLVKPTSSGNKMSLSATKFVYDGTAKKPTLTFKNGAGKAVSTFYYTVSYKNNKNVGTGSAVITLRNGYSGSFTINFTIVPKATSLTKLAAGKKQLTVKWKKQATQTTGYQLQYSTSGKYTSAKTINITKTSTLSKTITKLKSKKIYYVRVRTYKTVSGKKYYSSWSKGLGIKIK